jgi:hypothetical protein
MVLNKKLEDLIMWKARIISKNMMPIVEHIYVNQKLDVKK